MSLIVIVNVIFVALIVLAIPGLMAHAIWSSHPRRGVGRVQ